MSLANYHPPVSELLSYGKPGFSDRWLDYIEKLNLEPQHIPELLRMVTDEKLHVADSDSLEVWGTLHAWRALSQLKAIAAIEPLLNFLSDKSNEWLSDDFAKICTEIGLETIPFLEKFIADSSRDFYVRLDAANGLVALSTDYPETRTASIATITGVLEEFNDNHPEFNGFLVGCLVDLRAIESIETIERAFNADRVNPFIVGAWEDVQVDLGVKTWDDFPERKAERGLKEWDDFFERQNSPKKPFDSIISSRSSTRKPKTGGFGSSSSQQKKKKSRRASKRKKKR